MQKIEQTLLMLLEELRGTLPIDDALSELVLLVTWKQLVAKGECLLPSMKSVTEGEISLGDAYGQIATLIGSQGEVYLAAQLPRYLSTHQVVKLLSSVMNIQDVDDIPLFNAVVELISERMKMSRDMWLPTELVELMTALLADSSHDVYCPFSGSLQLAAKLSAKGRGAVYESPYIASPINCALSQLTDVTWSQSDPIQNPGILDQGRLKAFSNVVMAPPFGARHNEPISDPYHRFSKKMINGDVLAIEHALSQCDGRLVTLAPLGLLFRGANDYDLRTRLVDSGWLEAVIQLPAGLLPSTGIPVAVLVIDKQRDVDAPVLLFDANQPTWVKQGGRGRSNQLTGWQEISEAINKRQTGKMAVLVPRDYIQGYGYDLSVSRYVLGKASQAMAVLVKKEKTARLEDIVELIRVQALKEEKNPQGDEYLVVGPKDIGDDGYVMKPEKCLILSGRARDRAELQRLHPGDLLLMTKGNVGKVALVGANCADNWVASQVYQVIRTGPNTPIQSPEYLFRYLTSPLFQGYLSENSTGSTIPVLPTQKIQKLFIPIPSAEKQKQICQTHQEILAAHKRIRMIQQEIKALDQSHWPFEADEEASGNA